ncbi:MAG: DUF2310 family Zn-ribbon-containing protein [Clostridia bacterium]|nr:DUF2310 family Zn-ribbon-containing protein [Clostridia bacterium]
MFCKIELIPKTQINEENEENITDIIWTFLAALWNNGQILKNYMVTKDKNYILYVTFPKADSFDEKYDGIYVKQWRQKTNELFNITITALGENIESCDYCECTTRVAAEMQTYSRDIDSVFTCLSCGKPIALYELPLPGEDEKDFYSLHSWQENFAAMDMIWVNCLCDRYTGNQRVKYDSALNKQGYGLAKEIEKNLPHPIYYHLHCDYGNSIKTVELNGKHIHVCPKCQTIMKRVRFTDEIEIDICEKCHLSYDAH